MPASSVGDLGMTKIFGLGVDVREGVAREESFCKHDTCESAESSETGSRGFDSPTRCEKCRCIGVGVCVGLCACACGVLFVAIFMRSVCLCGSVFSYNGVDCCCVEW